MMFTVGLHGRGEQEPSEEAIRAILALIEKDHIPEAVEKSKAAPAAALGALRMAMKNFDDLVTTRKIAQAKSLLTAALKFVEALQWGEKGEATLLALEGRNLRLQGIELNDAKEYGEAEPLLRQALLKSQAAKDEVLEAGIRNNLGYSLRNQSKVEEASREFDAARKMAEAQNDSLRAGSYNFNLGNALLALGMNDPAFDAFKRAADQNREAGRKSLVARSTLMQGVVLSRISKVSEEPLKHFGDAQKIFETLGDDRNCGWSLYLMADHIAYRFKFEEAAELGEKAVPYMKKAEDKEGLLRCYTLLSDMHGRLQNTEKATEYRQLARKLSVKK
jgi:tetratricopeptide (TPR) repeat protein